MFACMAWSKSCTISHSAATTSLPKYTQQITAWVSWDCIHVRSRTLIPTMPLKSCLATMLRIETQPNVETEPLDIKSLAHLTLWFNSFFIDLTISWRPVVTCIFALFPSSLDGRPDTGCAITPKWSTHVPTYALLWDSGVSISQSLFDVMSSLP